MNTIKWLSPHTLAQRWGVHKETILRLVRSGELPAHKVNRRVYRISETDASVVYLQRYAKLAHLAQLATKPAGEGLSDRGKAAA
jgi:excisionase family DNA binding protein